MNALLRGIVLLLLAVSPSLLSATSQIPDTLLLDGEEQELAVELLAPWMAQHRPDWRPSSISSACWRGYQASWELKDNQLLLLKVGPCRFGDDNEKDEGDLWKELMGEAKPPLLAEWYTGMVRIPQGELVEYVHMGHASVYRRDLYMVVVKGVVVNQFEVRNDFNSMTYKDKQLNSIGHAVAPDGVLLPGDAMKVPGEWLDALLLRRDWPDTSEAERLKDKFEAALPKGATPIAPPTATPAPTEGEVWRKSIRGIWFDGEIYLPGNGATPALELRGKLAEGVAAPAPGMPVEAVVTYTRATDFRFESITALPDGAPLDRRNRIAAKRPTATPATPSPAASGS